MSTATQEKNSLDRSDLVVLCLFAVVSAVVATRHELGHDEVQAWNIARAADLPWDVIANGWYEGHTPFWHFLLWPLTRFGIPELMQALSVIFAVILAFLLLRDRPFPRWVCALALFGYFPFYEYSLIPRPYGVALLLCGLLATRLYRGGSSLLTLSVLCSLIGFTSAFGVVLSVSFMLLILLEATQESTRIRSINKNTLVTSLSVYTAFVLVAAWLIVFPTGSTSFESDVISGGALQTSWIPEPIITASFPHLDRLPLGVGSFAESSAGWWVTLCLALAVVIGILVRLLRSPAAVVPWLLAVVSISSAAATISSLSDRHVGHLFMAALVFCWASAGLVQSQDWHSPLRWWHKGPVGASSWSPPQLAALRPLAGFGLVLVLAYHVVVAAGAAGLDVLREQSPWRSIAHDIRDKVTPPYTLALDSGYLGGGVTAYLDADIYDMVCDCEVPYTQWNLMQALPTAEEVESHICDLVSTRQDLLLVLTYANWRPAEQFDLLATYGPGYRDSERPDVRLYRLPAEAAESLNCPA